MYEEMVDSLAAQYAPIQGQSCKEPGSFPVYLALRHRWLGYDLEDMQRLPENDSGSFGTRDVVTIPKPIGDLFFYIFALASSTSFPSFPSSYLSSLLLFSSFLEDPIAAFFCFIVALSSRPPVPPHRKGVTLLNARAIRVHETHPPDLKSLRNGSFVYLRYRTYH